MYHGFMHDWKIIYGIADIWTTKTISQCYTIMHGNKT